MASPRGRSRVGTVFGPYEIQSVIGVGGMGEVYRAYDTVRERTVAVKLLRTEFAADHGFQERFRRESRLAARLQEPHVIPVHDWGEINGVLYIDMRLVEGASVGAVLQNHGPLDPLRATSIVEQVAGALDAAHATGLIHRDVKPDNILLTDSGFAYLVDFGIAHFGGETGLTSAGSAIGSVVYMAPERFSAGPVGPGADVYSLACVFYECLTGQPPFPSGDLSQTMAAHLMKPPPRPSVVRPGIKPAFDDVIARGMAKRPELRFPTAGELARAAHAAGSSRQVAAPAPPPVQPQGTRQFSQRFPNPAATGYTPYPDHVRRSQTPARRSGLGRGQLALTVATAAMIAAAFVLALWLIVGDGGGQSVGPPIAGTTTEPTTAPLTETRLDALPGTDGMGFVDYPAARCDSGSGPAAMARTTQSLVVVCQTGPGDFYYRGLRLSDGASIELANAVRSSGGWNVANPRDGTRYVIRPDVLEIVQPDGRVFSEPIVDYTSS